MLAAKCISTAVGLILALLSSAAFAVEHKYVAFDISPDGKQVAFSSADGKLYVFDLESKTVHRIIETDALCVTPAFSPDGTSIAYCSTTPSSDGLSIYTTGLDGKKCQKVTNEQSVSDAIPVYSPDGSKLAFARAHLLRPYSMGGTTWDRWDVYVVDADGSNLKRVSRGEHRGINGLTFSKDGKSIYFAAESRRTPNDLTTNVFVVSSDGKAEPTQISPVLAGAKNAAWATEPTLSPNGKDLLVVSDRVEPYQYDLVVISLGDNAIKPLGATSISHYNRNPRFSPDATKIFFLAGTEWNARSRPVFSLWSIDVDGTNATQWASSSLLTDPTARNRLSPKQSGRIK
ncbi:MAG: TolB family protein [Pirellulales bacterium]